jgi:cytochrome c peroxidase
MRAWLLLSCVLIGAPAARAAAAAATVAWTPQAERLAASLSLSRLQPHGPADFPTNAVATSPAAARLGERLFFDPRLSRSGNVACASCHEPDGAFASARVVFAPERGYRSVPTLLGVSWQDFFYWDGRKDSLWSQAAGPLLSPVEHGLDERGLVERVVRDHRAAFERVFGRLPFARAAAATPDQRRRVVAAVGKALAAYEATIVPSRTAVDDFADALGAGDPRLRERAAARLGRCAEAGFALFVGKARCVSCHNGPLLTNGFFHNIGVPRIDARDNPAGRYVAWVMDRPKDPYVCGGPYDDAPPASAGRTTDACAHVRYAGVNNSQAGAFKTPTLRSVARTAPYMHNGAFATLRSVIDHYDQPPQAGNLGDPEVIPIGLNEGEKAALECFLRQL